LSPKSGDQIEKNEIGVTCSTYEGEKRFIQDFGEKPGGRDHSEDLCVDERIILRWVFRKWNLGHM
jgi:hypothetical protein